MFKILKFNCIPGSRLVLKNFKISQKQGPFPCDVHLVGTEIFHCHHFYLKLYKISSFFEQVVLAGDPMQLGPVIRSKLAKGHNFDLSLLERLVDMPIYARDKGKFVDHGAYNPLLVNILNYIHFSIHLHHVHFISFVSTGMLYRQCF